MAKPTQSVQKRHRERKKHERRQEKERRRAERMADKESGEIQGTEGSDVRDYFRDPEDPGDNGSKPSTPGG
jgi:hypothetical protein